MITWVAPDYQLSHPQNQAILNAMFTVGAFVTPMLIATSMHNMRGAVWPAYYILAGAAIVEAAFLPQLPSPDPIRHPVAGQRGGAAELGARAGDESADESADERTAQCQPLSP